jgi:hypothetical protein
MHYLLYLTGFGQAELFLLFIAFAYFGLIAYCLVDIIRSQFKDPLNKLVWILVVLLAPFLGSILYLFMGKSNKVD